MTKPNIIKNKNNTQIVALSLVLSTGITSFLPLQVLAKPLQNSSYLTAQSWNNRRQNNYRNPSAYPTNSNRPYSNSSYQSQNIALNSGAIIPTTHDVSRVLVTKQETMALVLDIPQNIVNNNNQVIIPAGSQIVGQISPSGNGSRFVANTLILPDKSEYPINAVSRVVTTTETVTAGRNTDAIWQGSLAGAGAAALLAGVTGDKRITPLELLGGASVGALGGLVLGGNRTQELIIINPQRDLELTLTSNFFMN